jgi:epoxide hydrolase-like predicted phosphatase
VSAAIEAVISDFGGVLTTPLIQSFAAVQDDTGVPFEAFGRAMARIAERDGENPLYELERGEISEARFLERLSEELAAELDHEPALHRFYEVFFDTLHPNEPMVEAMRGWRERGYRMALLTNNVREWEPVWRSKLPVDEIFEVIVDSAFVGMRKPEPGIYELTLERLGGVAPERAVFVDDVEVNCDAARELGLQAVRFRDAAQAIAEIEATLG